MQPLKWHDRPIGIVGLVGILYVLFMILGTGFGIVKLNPVSPVASSGAPSLTSTANAMIPRQMIVQTVYRYVGRMNPIGHAQLEDRRDMLPWIVSSGDGKLESVSSSLIVTTPGFRIDTNTYFILMPSGEYGMPFTIDRSPSTNGAMLPITNLALPSNLEMPAYGGRTHSWVH